MTTSSKKLRVCYFGTYSRGEEYARNNAIMSGLEKNGVEVIPCQVDVWPTYDDKMEGVKGSLFSTGLAFLRAYIKLIGKYLSIGDHDFVFVGYIGHIDVFPARILSWIRRKPMVFDAFYSLYDSLVDDRGLYSRNSFRALLLKFIDKWSCRLSDLVLLDTWAHVDYFRDQFGLKSRRFLAIPLGTDEKNFYPRELLPPAVA